MVFLSTGSFLNDIFGTGRNFDGVAFNLFGRDIYWYGIIIAMGVLVGYILACRDVKRRKMPNDTATDMVIWAMIFAIIFARLYYVVFDPNHHFTTVWDIIRISDGGLAIYGGVIGGALGLFIYSKIKKVRLSALFDVAAPCLAIGQAFGRWGNFMNQEAFGNPVTNPDFQWFPYAVYFNNPKGGFDAGWFQATFFYESFWCLLICVFIVLYRKRQRFSGEMALWYFLLYGIERAVVELLRQDQLILGNTGIPVSSLLSVILVLVSLTLLILGYTKVKQGKWHPATPGSMYYIDPDPFQLNKADQSYESNAPSHVDASSMADNSNNEVYESAGQSADLEANASDANSDAQDSSEHLLEQPSDTDADVADSQSDEPQTASQDEERDDI